VTREERRRGALEAIDGILSEGADADEVLRAVVGALAPLYDGVALRFVEGGRLVEGPAHGVLGDGGSTVPVRFQGAEVARLDVSPVLLDDHGFLERVTALIAPYCLVAWDTGGEPWQP
jgi:hypothetical protein